MKKFYIIPLLLLLLTACAAPGGNQNAANSNAGNVNANARAESRPAPPLPPHLTPPEAPGNQNASAAQTNGATDFSQVNPTKAAADLLKPAASGKQPKVMLASRRIDLGTQAPEKTISHSIRVKNDGKSELKIENVVPG